MRLRSALILGAAILVIAAGGVLWWLYASREALIKQAIERYGPDFTGVSVTVKSVKLEPVDGIGAITRLEVGNPAGFTAQRALTLGEIRLAVDPRTLTSDVVRIKEISLEAPYITYERTARGDNLSAIQRHIESRLPKRSASDSKATGPGRKFIVDHLQVRNARVSYGGAVTVDMPDLHLRDLGKKTNGASAAQIADEVWKEITRMAVSRAPAALEGLRDRAKEAVDGVRGIFK
jgi:hypothetical protein